MHGGFSSCLYSLGLKVAPAFHTSSSPELASDDPQVLDLLVYLVANGRLRSVLCCLPSGAFFRSHRKVRDSGRPVTTSASKERRALRMLLLLRTCASYGVPCILVFFKKFEACRLASFRRCLSCQRQELGAFVGVRAPSSNDVGWISVWTPAAGLDRPCLCKPHCRFPCQPAFPALSCDGASALVSCLWAGAQLVDPPDQPASGLESALLNDVLLTSSWRSNRTWRWPCRRPNARQRVPEKLAGPRCTRSLTPGLSLG